MSRSAAKTERMLVYLDGWRPATVTHGNKWVTVTTLRKKKKLTKGQFSLLRTEPLPNDEKENA